MNDVILDGQSPVVDINRLPVKVLEAMINKINARTQVSRRIFKSEYKISIDDLRLLIERISEEFKGKKVITRLATVSIVFENNARHDFASWDQFERFDRAQPERTKSVSVEVSISMFDAEETLQSFKVQVSIQNDAPKIGMIIGPIGLNRIEDIGIPPVPILASIEYNDFIMGKNLLATVESWEKGLARREPAGLQRLQKHSDKIRKGIELLSTASSMVFCLFLSTLLSAVTGLENLVNWLISSALFVFLGSSFGTFVGRRTERNIDSIDAGPNFMFSRGDTNHEAKVLSKNKSFSRNAIFYFIAAGSQIMINLLANHIWEIIHKS